MCFFFLTIFPYTFYDIWRDMNRRHKREKEAFSAYADAIMGNSSNATLYVLKYHGKYLSYGARNHLIDRTISLKNHGQ
jgi:hypothetical protein